MPVGYEKQGQPHADRPAGPQAGAGPGGNDWDALKDDVSEAADAAFQRGRHFLDSAREQATGYVDQRKGDVAQSVADLATSVRESLRSFDDRPNIKAFADSAAEGLDQLAETIRSRSFNDMLYDVEQTMRRRPGAVIVASTLAGLVLARFIKASADDARAADLHRRRTAAPAGPYRRPG